jgi:hypothetical protein
VSQTEKRDKKNLAGWKTRLLSRKRNCPAESIESNYFIKIAGGGRSLLLAALSLTHSHISQLWYLCFSRSHCVKAKARAEKGEIIHQNDTRMLKITKITG